MKCRKGLAQSGFSLIEIIVTMIFVAIFSAMVLTFLSKSLVDSADPVKRLRQASDLHKVMANIMADYNRYPKWRSGTTYTFGNYVVPTIRNGHFYTTSGGGTSGSKEPDWPPKSLDNNITWTDGGLLPNLTTLKTNIGSENSHQNNAYGTYDVVHNTFVQFPLTTDAETAGGNNILKVTIKNDQGGTLTALFISN
jgi:prepilin-type N-terminal cleavage/methylation domain-containing protein